MYEKELQESENFMLQGLLEHIFLLLYTSNTADFYLLFSEDIKQKYAYDETDIEHILEFIRDLSIAIAFKTQNFILKQDDMFYKVLHIAGNKKKKDDKKIIIEYYALLTKLGEYHDN